MDSSVQRSITKSREAKIKVVETEFDWAKLGVFEVRELDSGQLRVAKGQGRTLGMVRRNPDTMVTVCVVKYGDDKIENLAALAEDDPKGKAAQTAAERWTYAVGGQEPRHLWGLHELDGLGLSVDLSHPRSFTNITAVSQLTRLLYGNSKKSSYRDYNTSKTIFKGTIQAIVEIYPEDIVSNSGRFESNIIESIGLVLEKNAEHPSLNTQRLVDRIRLDYPVPQHLTSMAKQAPRGCPGSTAGYLCNKLVESYNFNLHGDAGNKIVGLTDSYGKKTK